MHPSAVHSALLSPRISDTEDFLPKIENGIAFPSLPAASSLFGIQFKQFGILDSMSFSLVNVKCNRDILPIGLF